MSLSRRYPTAEWWTRLGAHAVKLALLDVVARAPHAQFDAFAEPSPVEVAQVTQLLHAVPPTFYEGNGPVLLNPTFGNSSPLVGGADADLIVGDRLIDIKTGKSDWGSRPDVHQVLLYFLLSRHARREDSSKPAIERIQIYVTV